MNFEQHSLDNLLCDPKEFWVTLLTCLWKAFVLGAHCFTIPLQAKVNHAIESCKCWTDVTQAPWKGFVGLQCHDQVRNMHHRFFGIFIAVGPSFFATISIFFSLQAHFMCTRKLREMLLSHLKMACLFLWTGQREQSAKHYIVGIANAPCFEMVSCIVFPHCQWNAVLVKETTLQNQLSYAFITVVLCTYRVVSYQTFNRTCILWKRKPSWHPVQCTVYCWVSISDFANKVLMTVVKLL